MAFRKMICRLPNNEGSISVEICEGVSKEKFIMNHSLSSFTLTHENNDPENNCIPRCGGKFKTINISDAKKALVCSHCALRITIPTYVASLKQLKNALDNSWDQ